MRRAILAALLALGLAGCAPTLAASNQAGGVIHRGAGINEGAALKLADAHCKQFGKVARISGENVFESSFTFDCVAP